jgi:hypothetical protein
MVMPLNYSPIAEELLKQLQQLPVDFQKKVLEYAQSLNATKVKGKSGKDLLKFAGTFDQDNLKVMEEAIQYGCE